MSCPFTLQPSLVPYYVQLGIKVLGLLLNLICLQLLPKLLDSGLLLRAVWLVCPLLHDLLSSAPNCPEIALFLP